MNNKRLEEHISKSAEAFEREMIARGIRKEDREFLKSKYVNTAEQSYKDSIKVMALLDGRSLVDTLTTLGHCLSYLLLERADEDLAHDYLSYLSRNVLDNRGKK